MNLYLRLLLVQLRNRTRGPISLWDTSKTTLRVMPNDLDVFGHMNNGRYLTIMDIGRMDLMGRCGFWDKLKEQDWYPVVAGQTITYRRSLKPGQKFDLYTRVMGFDEKWGFIEQTFVVGDKIYAQAVVRTRFLKKSGGSVEQDEIRELAGGFPDDLVLPEWVVNWTEAAHLDSVYSPK